MADVTPTGPADQFHRPHYAEPFGDEVLHHQPGPADQIPGTRTMRRILAEILGALDPLGIARLPRRPLAELLCVAERTLTILVGRLRDLGLVRQPYGRWFVFAPSSELLQLSRELRGLASNVDPKTLELALAAFLDGRSRAGAPLREDADPSLAPFLLSHARSLATKGQLRGMDPIQLVRLMGEAYVLDTRDQKLEAQCFPLHPKWIRPVLPQIAIGVAVRLAAERKRADERREGREAAREAAPRPDYQAARAGALSLLGALPTGAT